MKKDFANTLVELLTPIVRDSVRKSIDKLLIEGRIQPEKNDLMLIGECAELIGVKKSSLYTNICRKGNHPPFSKRGRRLYFSRREVLQWISEGRKK